MANEYLLSEYADEAALQKQTAFILQSFDTIEAKAKTVGIALKDVFGNLNNTNVGTKQIIEDFKKMEVAAGDVVKVTKTSTDALKQQNITLTETAKLTKEVTASLQQNVETRRRLQNTMQSYLKDQKEDLALLKAGTITRAEYNKRITESQIKIEQYKNRITDLDREIKKQTATEGQRHKEVIANLTREEKLQKQVYESERNSLGRAQALILLYTEQKKKLNLATADGARLNESYNKAIQKSNAFILANADAETKRSKNVGNYAAAAQLIVNALEKEKIKLQALTGSYQNFTSQLQLSRTVVTGFGTALANPTAFKETQSNLLATTSKISLLKSEIQESRTRIEGFNRKLKDVELKKYATESDKATDSTEKLGSSFVKSGGKAFSFLRTLANIIPGLGIGGLIGILVEPIIAATKALFGFGEVSEKVRMQQEANAAAYKSAADNVGEEVAKVTVLKAVLESENTTRLQKKTALEDLKGVNADYFGQLDLEGDKVKGLENAYDAYIQKLLRSITAKASIEQLTAVIREQVNIAAKLNQKGFGEGSKTAANLTDYDILYAVRKFNLDFGAANKERSVLSGEQLKLIADLLNKEASINELTKRIQGGIQDVFEPKGDKTGKKGTAQLQALKEETNTEFEIYKIRQERKLKNFDDDIKSDKLHYLDKLIALKNYVEASQELIDRQEKEDIRKKEEAAAREIKRLNEEKKGKDPAQVARLNENIKIIEENLQQDILLIQAQAADKSVELSRNASKVKEGILADQLKREKELYDEYAKNEQDVLDKTNDRYKKALEKRLKDEEAAAKKRVELEKELQGKKVQLAEQAERFLFSLGEASFTRQLNAIRDLKDAAEAKAARDIEIANASTATEEEKAAQIAIINARLQYQKDALDKKARDTEVQKAKFQRAQQIFEIGITAIKSIAAIKAQAAILLANPLTAALAPIALAQIPIVLGGAALGIAGVLAQPIPRFFRGKKKGEPYKGPAFVNDHPDGRTKEAIVREDGTIEMPEGRNVLTHVNPGDVVHPDRDAFLKDLQRTALRNTARVANGKINEAGYVSAMTAALKSELQQNSKYLKQIANKPAGDFHLHLESQDYFNLKVNW